MGLKFITYRSEHVLSKGLNFAITPDTLLVEEFVVAIEKGCHKMEADKAESFRNDVLGVLSSAKCPQPNMNVQERKALFDLKKNQSILILPADKGRATVVVDKDDYEKKVSDMLGDRKTYEELKRDPTPIYKRKLMSVLTRLKDEDKISSDMYFRLYPTSEKIPQLYCLPKIHKKMYPSDR